MSNLRSRWTGVELDDASVALPWTAICASGDEEAHEPLVPGPLPEPDVGWAPVPELAAAETTLELLVEMLHADAEAASHKLLVRAGFVRQLMAGHYSLTPLGFRSLRKVEGIIREEMDRIGAQEFRLPCMHPREIWERSGRWDSVG